MRKGQTVLTDWENQHHAPQAYYDRLWERLSVGLHRQREKRELRKKAKEFINAGSD